MSPKKKLNNRKNYQLSENSRKSSVDFREANRLSSAIYAIFKQLLRQGASRDQYQRLNKRLIKVMHSGPDNLLGQRKLYQGNVGLLKGFRLNPYTIWSSLIHFQPTINVLPADQVLQIRVPAILSSDLNVPTRTSRVALQFVCCEVEVDTCQIKLNFSAKLMLHPKQGALVSTAKKVNMHIPQMEGKVLLVLILVRTYLWGDYDPEIGITSKEFLSNDRKYYAAELLEAVYIKDGQVVENVTEEKVWQPKTDLTAQVDAQWEDEE